MKKGLGIVSLLVAAALVGYALVETRQGSRQEVSEAAAGEVVTGPLSVDSGNSLQVSGVVLPKQKKNEELIVKKKLKNLNIDVSRSLVIEGPITMSSTDVALGIKNLNVSSETSPIYLILTSPGGSVIAGAEIINAITQSKAPIYTICRAFCASMASMIHQYGTKRYVTDRSLIMFHPASTGAEGKVNEISNYINSTKNFVTKIEVEVSRRLGLSIAEYQTKVGDEWWIDSDEALQAKVVDNIISLDLNPELFDSGAGQEEYKKNLGNITKGRKLIWIYEGVM